MTIDLTVPPDDLSLTVPAEQTEYVDWYAYVSLVDESGNTLVDESGNTLIATQVTTENVYVMRAGTDDLSLTVPAETLEIFVAPDDLNVVVNQET